MIGQTTKMRRWRHERVRATDPDTSRAAIAEMTEAKLNAAQDAVLEAIRRLGGRACDIELVYEYRENMEDLPRQSPSGIRTRRAELVAAGKLADIGLRVRTESDRHAIVWSVVA